jgi:glycosyltransferase involved in cell wall biosynthesis
MNILHVNTLDAAGGAERVASQLADQFRQRGHSCWLAVGEKRNFDRNVLSLQTDRSVATQLIARLHRKIRKSLGHQIFFSPESWRLLDIAPARPDIVHLHNLHGARGYFDLRALTSLSHQVPVVLTLHDMWLMTGHCAHSFDCERWRTGCGQCPDLSIYPAVRRDATAFNWKHRQELFSRSRLFVTTPSQWLMDKVKDSILAPAIVDSKIIPNAIDTAVFCPATSKDSIRSSLDLPVDALILAFSANGIRHNTWKDFASLRETLRLVAEQINNRKLILLAIGETAPPEQIGAATISFIPYQSTPSKLAAYYHAADVYIHAARAEVWGLTITEAMACGCAVVATDVGGIREQVDDSVTGFLTPFGDPRAMASTLIRLLNDRALQTSLGTAGAAKARERFGVSAQITAFLEFYSSAIRKHTDVGHDRASFCSQNVPAAAFRPSARSSQKSIPSSNPS